MAIGDETQAGPRPSIPPRRPPGLGDFDTDSSATQKMSGDSGFGPGDFPAADSSGGYGGDDPYSDSPRRNVPPPRILAPQANEWATSMQEVEVVKARRTGLVLLSLLALLLVALVALGLAAFSVLNSGDEVAGSGAGTSTVTTATTADLSTTVTTVATTIVDPTKLQVAITEEPFVCDGGTRPFAQLSGAAPNEEVAFSSPQSSALKSGTADAGGALPIRWQCDPEQAGTTWELTATGVTSGKSVTFIFAGATAAATATTAVPTTAAPTALTVNLVENPFACNGEARIFGGITGAAPGEEVAFTSPQATNILSGKADADGALSIRWVCSADKVGTTWELTATGVTSGRSVTFTFTGS